MSNRKAILLSATLHIGVIAALMLELPKFEQPLGVTVPIPPIPIEVILPVKQQTEQQIEPLDNIGVVKVTAKSSVAAKSEIAPDHNKVAEKQINEQQINEQQIASIPPLPKPKPLIEVPCKSPQKLPPIDGSGISYAQAALAAQEQGRHKLAIKLYTQATEAGGLTDKGLSGIHVNLGVSYKRLGLIDLAKQHYEKALRLRPGYQKALYNLSILNDKTIAPKC